MSGEKISDRFGFIKWLEKYHVSSSGKLLLNKTKQRIGFIKERQLFVRK